MSRTWVSPTERGLAVRSRQTETILTSTDGVTFTQVATGTWAGNQRAAAVRVADRATVADHHQRPAVLHGFHPSPHSCRTSTPLSRRPLSRRPRTRLPRTRRHDRRHRPPRRLRGRRLGLRRRGRAGPVDLRKPARPAVHAAERRRCHLAPLPAPPPSDARPRLPSRDDRPLRHLGADHRRRRSCHRGLSRPAPNPTLPRRAVRQSQPTT